MPPPKPPSLLVPEFLHLPALGRLCPYTALPGAWMATLAEKGAIQAARLRDPSPFARSILLVHFESLLHHLLTTPQKPLTRRRPPFDGGVTDLAKLFLDLDNEIDALIHLNSVPRNDPEIVALREECHGRNVSRWRRNLHRAEAMLKAWPRNHAAGLYRDLCIHRIEDHTSGSVPE